MLTRRAYLKPFQIDGELGFRLTMFKITCIHNITRNVNHLICIYRMYLYIYSAYIVHVHKYKYIYVYDTYIYIFTVSILYKYTCYAPFSIYNLCMYAT